MLHRSEPLTPPWSLWSIAKRWQLTKRWQGGGNFCLNLTSGRLYINFSRSLSHLRYHYWLILSITRSCGIEERSQVALLGLLVFSWALITNLSMIMDHLKLYMSIICEFSLRLSYFRFCIFFIIILLYYKWNIIIVMHDFNLLLIMCIIQTYIYAYEEAIIRKKYYASVTYQCNDTKLSLILIQYIRKVVDSLNCRKHY